VSSPRGVPPPLPPGGARSPQYGGGDGYYRRPAGMVVPAGEGPAVRQQRTSLMRGAMYAQKDDQQQEDEMVMSPLSQGLSPMGSSLDDRDMSESDLSALATKLATSPNLAPSEEYTGPDLPSRTKFYMQRHKDLSQSKKNLYNLNDGNRVPSDSVSSVSSTGSGYNSYSPANLAVLSFNTTSLRSSGLGTGSGPSSGASSPTLRGSTLGSSTILSSLSNSVSSTASSSSNISNTSSASSVNMSNGNMNGSSTPTGNKPRGLPPPPSVARAVMSGSINVNGNTSSSGRPPSPNTYSNPSMISDPNFQPTAPWMAPPPAGLKGNLPLPPSAGNKRGSKRYSRNIENGRRSSADDILLINPALAAMTAAAKGNMGSFRAMAEQATADGIDQRGDGGGGGNLMSNGFTINLPYGGDDLNMQYGRTSQAEIEAIREHRRSVNNSNANGDGNSNGEVDHLTLDFSAFDMNSANRAKAVRKPNSIPSKSDGSRNRNFSDKDQVTESTSSNVSSTSNVSAASGATSSRKGGPQIHIAINNKGKNQASSPRKFIPPPPPPEDSSPSSASPRNPHYPHPHSRTPLPKTTGNDWDPMADQSGWEEVDPNQDQRYSSLGSPKHGQ